MARETDGARVVPVQQAQCATRKEGINASAAAIPTSTRRVARLCGGIIYTDQGERSNKLLPLN